MEKDRLLGTVIHAKLIPPDREHSVGRKGERCAEDEMGTDGVVQLLAAEESSPTSRTDELLGKLEIDIDHLTPRELEDLKALLVLYSDVFALTPAELGTTDVVTHSIDTVDHRPVTQQVRRTPFALREKVDLLVKEMMEQKVVEPYSSPWASPIMK